MEDAYGYDARDSWSDADRIFVPTDFDNDLGESDFTQYKVVFFRTVPENCVLVRKNRFTGKITVLDGSGPKFMTPFFTKSILISTVDRTINYNAMKYKTIDGIHAEFNIALTVRITDPKKYMLHGKEQINGEGLYTLIQDMLRVYCSEKTSEELLKDKVNFTEFNANGELNDFASRYGITIANVKLQDVKLPKELENAMERETIAKKNKEAKRIELETYEMEEKTKRDVEVLRIKEIEKAKADAYIDRMSRLVDSLIAKGIPANKIADQIQTLIAAEHPNANFIISGGKGNDIASNIAAGVAAGRASTSKTSTQSSSNHLTNTERLVSLIQSLLSLGLVSQDNMDSYHQMLQVLTDPNNQHIANGLNSLSEAEFDKISDAVKIGDLHSFTSSSSTKTR